MWGAEVLRLGARWSLGDGKSIAFWLDVWVHENPLIKIAVRIVEEADLHKRVFKYWEEGRGWRWDLFAHLLT